MQPYPPYQQPSTPPKKSHKTLFIVLGVVLGVVLLPLLGCIGISALEAGGGLAAQQVMNTTATQTAQFPTAQPTQPPATGTWTTTHAFIGNGNKKTAIFTAPNDWKILDSCTYQNIGE